MRSKLTQPQLQPNPKALAERSPLHDDGDDLCGCGARESRDAKKNVGTTRRRARAAAAAKAAATLTTARADMDLDPIVLSQVRAMRQELQEMRKMIAGSVVPE